MRTVMTMALLSSLVASCAHAGARVPPDSLAERRARRQDAALFVRVGCNDCHSVSALGLKASADVGPDLTYAYADVVNRYGVNLESFLAHPTGIMRLMLGAHLDLSDADRNAIIRILKTLHEERRADLDDTPPPRAPASADRSVP